MSYTAATVDFFFSRSDAQYDRTIMSVVLFAIQLNNIILRYIFSKYKTYKSLRYAVDNFRSKSHVLFR